MKLSLAPNRSFKITIPKKVIEALEWKPGDDIKVNIKGKKIMLTNVK